MRNLTKQMIEKALLSLTDFRAYLSAAAAAVHTKIGTVFRRRFLRP